MGASLATGIVETGNSDVEAATPEPAPTVTVTATPEAEPTEEAGGGETAARDDSAGATTLTPGAYIMGVDAESGLYRSTEPIDEDALGCCDAEIKDDGDYIWDETIFEGNVVFQIPDEEGILEIGSGCPELV